MVRLRSATAEIKKTRQGIVLRTPEPRTPSP
jgi:hypothetical protein